MPQGSILGPLLFLVYVNDMPQAAKSNLFLYADDSCLMYQNGSVEEIEKKLNKGFENVCNWFVENRLSTHFGALGRIEPNLFFLQVNVKQHLQVTYLSSVLDETLPGEPLALKALNKVNGKLKFLYRKNKFPTPALRRMLCNAII